MQVQDANPQTDWAVSIYIGTSVSAVYFGGRR